MSNIFKLEDIKAGYLIEVQIEGLKDHVFMTVLPCNTDLRGETLACVCPDNQWWPMDEWDHNLMLRKQYMLPASIVKVYGCTHPKFMLDNETIKRALLWERKELKRMTKSEIQEALGYEIEIVPEKED